MSESALDQSMEPAPGGDAVSSSVRMVPRISIQAHCVSQDTVQELQKAAGDRRLARAHVSVETGGLAGAIDAYTDAPTPNLVIVESDADREQLFVQLDQLAAVCDTGTKVVVVGQVNDVILYRDLIRQGVSDYIVAPISVLQVIEAIGGIYQDPDAEPVGKTVAFIGAKGGAGSSTVAHNVAWSVAELLGENVVVTDLDLAFGTVGLDFNQDPPQGIAEALSSPDRLDEVLLDRLLSKCTEKLNLFTAPSTLDREYDIDHDALESIIDLLRTTAPCVALDMPHMWTGWARRVLLDADHILITATPDLASLRNTKNLFESLRAQRPNDRPPLYLLNQCSMPKRPEISAKDFAEALSVAPVLTIDFDPQLFGIASNNGQMIAELQNGAKVAEGFTELAKLITGRSEVKEQRKGRFGLKLGLRRKKG